MSFLSKLFSNTKKAQCPRCLGKGHVDEDDIKRLKRELKWRPGKCAYCNGSGEVTPAMLENVDVHTTYLTTDLSEDERRRLFKGDEDAHQRASNFEIRVDDFAKQIEYLYFVAKLEVYQIADFFMIPESDVEKSHEEEEELLEYIERVIERAKRR